MHASFSRWFPYERELLYRHNAEFENFENWSKMPDDITYEFTKSDTGECNGIEMTLHKPDGDWKYLLESVYAEKNRETQTVLTGFKDPDGNELLGSDSCPMKEMSSRTRYRDVNDGTEIAIDLYMKPLKFSCWLDTYLSMRDWKRRNVILLELLDDYLKTHHN